MNYLTLYYKNLSEQLQEQVNLLEAGLQKALRSNKKEVLGKEFDKTAARHRRILNRNIPLEDPNSAVPFERRLDDMDKNLYSAVNLRKNNMNVLLDRMRTLDRKENENPYPTPSQMAAEMMAGTRDIKTKKPIKPIMTPDLHDGPDPDETATADEVEASQKAKQLGEATMSKATRLGKKYPGTVARATEAQTRRLPKKQKHRDDLRREAESEAALEYAADAKGSQYASGADAENWWRESRGEDPRYGVGKANERVQDVIGNLAKLSILKFFDYRKAKKKKK